MKKPLSYYGRYTYIQGHCFSISLAREQGRGNSGEADIDWQQDMPVTRMLVAKARRAAAVISADAPQDPCSDLSLVAGVPRSGWMLKNLVS